MSYTELFITQNLDSSHYAAVIFEHDTASFYHALFECACVGGSRGCYLKEKGMAIDLDTVGKLAYKSKESRTEVTTVSGRPSGKVNVNRKLKTEEIQQNAFFSFEKKMITTDLVEIDTVPYIRVVRYDCSAEGNGRPVYTLIEDYYGIHKNLIDFLTSENWRALAEKTAAYHFTASGVGVLF